MLAQQLLTQGAARRIVGRRTVVQEETSVSPVQCMLCSADVTESNLLKPNVDGFVELIHLLQPQAVAFRVATPYLS